MYTLTDKEISDLICAAFSVRKLSYSPYSGFSVGSAVLCDDGDIYSGCNIENSSYPVGICAERTAISKAVSSGKHDFKAIAIVGGISDNSILEYCQPCGMCRQFLSEFCDKDFVVILAKSQAEYKLISFDEIFPFPFEGKTHNRSDLSQNFA